VDTLTLAVCNENGCLHRRLHERYSTIKEFAIIRISDYIASERARRLVVLTRTNVYKCENDDRTSITIY